MGFLSVVRRLSVVRVAVISVPNTRITFKFWLLLPRFLALLDSVSRAHGMGLLSVVRRPSIVRAAVISESNAQISFKFWLWLPLDHTLTHVLNFSKKTYFQIFYDFFSFL